MCVFGMWISGAGNLQANDTILPLTLILSFSQPLTAAPWQEECVCNACVCVCVREREVCRQTVSGVKVSMLGMHLLSFDWEVNRECAPPPLSLSYETIEVKCSSIWHILCGWQSWGRQSGFYMDTVFTFISVLYESMRPILKCYS